MDEYKLISGYDNRYEINRRGSVKSVLRQVSTRGNLRWFGGKELIAQVAKDKINVLLVTDNIYAVEVAALLRDTFGEYSLAYYRALMQSKTDKVIKAKSAKASEENRINAARRKLSAICYNENKAKWCIVDSQLHELDNIYLETIGEALELYNKYVPAI